VGSGIIFSTTSHGNFTSNHFSDIYCPLSRSLQALLFTKMVPIAFMINASTSWKVDIIESISQLPIREESKKEN